MNNFNSNTRKVPVKIMNNPEKEPVKNMSKTNFSKENLKEVFTTPKKTITPNAMNKTNGNMLGKNIEKTIPRSRSGFPSNNNNGNGNINNGSGLGNNNGNGGNGNSNKSNFLGGKGKKINICMYVIVTFAIYLLISIATYIYMGNRIDDLEVNNAKITLNNKNLTETNDALQVLINKESCDSIRNKFSNIQNILNAEGVKIKDIK